MNRKACISIIIPTLNESYFLSKLLPHLLKADEEHLIVEIIVADGGSTDNTCLVANLNSTKLVHCPERGRAKQMNFAAKEANGQILHFIHADAFPPQGFTTDVFLAWKAQSCGCFRSLFQTNSVFLQFNSYFTRFKANFFRGGGQTLFVDRQLFEQLNGYREDMNIMEEYDLIIRLKKNTKFTVIQRDVIVSARDYEKYGRFSLQAKYFLLVLLFFSGLPHCYLEKVYQLLCKKKILASKKTFMHEYQAR